MKVQKIQILLKKCKQKTLSKGELWTVFLYIIAIDYAILFTASCKREIFLELVFL